MCDTDQNYNKMEEKRKEERLLTFREQRLNVNFMLLLYWIPAYVIDISSQFPTYDGVHIFSDYLSNWGQSIILVYLVASIFMDLMPDEDRKIYKNMHNKFTQITVVQAYIVSALYWGLIEPKWDFSGMHEHAMNLVVVMISYFVSEVRFRKRDLLNMWVYGWIYMANTYLVSFFGRDSIYSVLTWGEKDPNSTFPLTAFQLAYYAIFGGVTFLHGFMWTVDQLRWKVYERNEKKNKIQLAMQRAGS
jgi:hypothetical protein